MPQPPFFAAVVVSFLEPLAPAFTLRLSTALLPGSVAKSMLTPLLMNILQNKVFAVRRGRPSHATPCDTHATHGRAAPSLPDPRPSVIHGQPYTRPPAGPTTLCRGPGNMPLHRVLQRESDSSCAHTIIHTIIHTYTVCLACAVHTIRLKRNTCSHRAPRFLLARHLHAWQ